VTCSRCSGRGDVTCSTCTGHGRLRHFRRLDVAWRTHTTDRILEKTDLPDHLVRGVAGVLELAEEDARIEPKIGGGGPFRGETRVSEEVNAAANALVAEQVFGEGEKLHRQRLVVRGVPVHEASYRWGKATRRFWVYGLERAVHAPDFPLSTARLGIAIAIAVIVLGAIVGVVVYAYGRG
jgi:hypothetical protein